MSFLVAVPAWAQDQKVYDMRIQTAVPSASLFYKLLEQMSANVDTMSNGRLKIDVLPAGAVVQPFEQLDATAQGLVEGCFAWGNYWSGKHPAYVLFANAPASTGLDQDAMLAWYYRGEGEKLYNELDQEIMGLDLKPFIIQPIGPDPLGWFKSPINSLADFKKMKYRSPPGIAGQTYKEMGVSAVSLPAAEIVPAAQRGVIDGAEWTSPSDDLNLGLDKIWKNYYLQGLHQQTDMGELQVNKTFWDSLPKDLRAIFRSAVQAQVSETLQANIDANSQALQEMEAEGVKVHDTPDEYYPAFIKAQNKITAEYAKKNKFFKKVLDSQIAYAKKIYPYRSQILELYTNLVNTAHEEQSAR
ncbi:TRAP transporter substrate-binding protein [Salinisphaera aquimarina]|uniref:TRAP transporter substrate-binding protein n=1 Tax=Salinisphaera aquimarina TaxID=2094031 RepID=A0ABV7ESW9_9GAMM